ncbi:DUF6283 family protein [Nonomuraea sp. NPDC050451]|uniref:DUF6283 family protein n=1 Tax=Nonomuraea sp. NPDC050451 TaxID=3364364 RepID=UPI00379A4015
MFRRRPCDGDRKCPWRTDADLTAFTKHDMARLLRAERGVRAADSTLADDMRAAEATAMSCHKDQPGTAHPMRLCAGRLAVVGPHHVPTRMSLIAGTLPIEAVHPDTRDWPALHASLTELVARRQEQLSATASTQPPPRAPATPARWFRHSPSISTA